MAKRYRPDRILFATTLALLMLGVVMVFSASAVYAAELFGHPAMFLLRQAMWLTLGLPALQEGQPSGFFLGLMLIGGASVLAYPLSCLIVAGVKSRIWRVAVFGLMFWAAYGGIILFQGNLRFAL